MQTSSKPVIGIVEHISIGRRAIDVPAKIDTGADSSSIWASNIRIGSDGVLRFRLFGEGSPYYNGKIFKRTDFKVAQIKNSTGKSEVRYRTYFTIDLGSKKIKALFNLSDRSNNTYKVLIGRRTISRKFIVDVSKGYEKLPKPNQTVELNKKLQSNPYNFHKEYIEAERAK